VREVVFKTPRTDDYDVAEFQRELDDRAELPISLIDRDRDAPPTRPAQDQPS
jgi:hypothetical protein